MNGQTLSWTGSWVPRWSCQPDHVLQKLCPLLPGACVCSWLGQDRLVSESLHPCDRWPHGLFTEWTPEKPQMLSCPGSLKSTPNHIAGREPHRGAWEVELRAQHSLVGFSPADSLSPCPAPRGLKFKPYCCAACNAGSPFFSPGCSLRGYCCQHSPLLVKMGTGNWSWPLSKKL